MKKELVFKRHKSKKKPDPDYLQTKKIDIIGKVYKVELRTKKEFVLYLDDKHPVIVPLPSHFEETVIDALKNRESTLIRVTGIAKVDKNGNISKEGLQEVYKIGTPEEFEFDTNQLLEEYKDFWSKEEVEELKKTIKKLRELPW